MPADEQLRIAERIKERYAYVCGGDLVREFNKYDADARGEAGQWLLRYEGVDTRTQRPFSVDVGHERFLAGEVFFHPEIAGTENAAQATPLPDAVQQAVQASPIDVRRALYSHIVLSGGSTLIDHFGRRLQRDVQSRVAAQYGNEADVKVKVHGSRRVARYAVWLGGSLLASTGAAFTSVCHTRADYAEYGPSIARRYNV